jgi:hypothetical protein
MLKYNPYLKSINIHPKEKPLTEVRGISFCGDFTMDSKFV